MAEADTESDDKYSNGKIYRLDYGGLTYIGSTCYSLKKRVKDHRNGSGCTSELLYEQAAKDGGTVIMTLIEDYPCKSNTELTRREGFYQQQIECVNRRVAGRTHAESCKAFYEANRETRLEGNKVWREDNKEARREYKKAYRAASPTVSCECGGVYKQCDQSQHIKTQQHQRFVAASSQTPPGS
jgi:hypothetical protein